MRFSQIHGNEDIVKALVSMADSGRVPHAILFHENDGGGAMPLILAFLQYLNCPQRTEGDSCGTCPSCNQTSKLIYPDIHFTFPIANGGKVPGESKDMVCSLFMPYWRELVLGNPYFLENEVSVAFGIEKKVGIIPVNEGKAIMAKLSLSSVCDGYRAVVVYLPEKMNQQTANMLLKSIEEPSDKTLFLMITHSPEDVLQTISSRCLHIRVLPLSKDDVKSTLVETFKIEEELARYASDYCSGSPGLALRFVSDKPSTNGLEAVFGDLMDALTRSDLRAALECGETLAGLDSREKQKAFCTFAGEGLRKILMVQQGMDEISGVAPEEEEYYKDLAKKLSKSFSRKAAPCLDRAVNMIERNVNQKVLFTNLVIGLFRATITK